MSSRIDWLGVTFVGLAVAALAYGNATHPLRHSDPCMSGYSDSEEGWQRLHQIHNHEYFGGKLPEVIVMSSESPVSDGDMAQTRWTDPPVILIAPSKIATFGAAELILFHEECHLAVGHPAGMDPHGPAWKSCMRRLALSGALDDLW